MLPDSRRNPSWVGRTAGTCAAVAALLGIGAVAAVRCRRAAAPALPADERPAPREIRAGRQSRVTRACLPKMPGSVTRICETLGGRGLRLPISGNARCRRFVDGTGSRSARPANGPSRKSNPRAFLQRIRRVEPVTAVTSAGSARGTPRRRCVFVVSVESIPYHLDQPAFRDGFIRGQERVPGGPRGSHDLHRLEALRRTARRVEHEISAPEP
jgi:hypothetical protein